MRGVHVSNGAYTGRWLTATAEEREELPEALRVMGEAILADGGKIALFLISEPFEGARRALPNPFWSGYQHTMNPGPEIDSEPQVVLIGDGRRGVEGEIWINACLVDRE